MEEQVVQEEEEEQMVEEEEQVVEEEHLVKEEGQVSCSTSDICLKSKEFWVSHLHLLLFSQNPFGIFLWWIYINRIRLILI